MSDFDTATAWARARAAGPTRVAPSTAVTPGMRRLVEADASGVWLLPIVPEGAGPTVLDELGLAATGVEQPNDTARVLAACLRCCWSEPTGPPWPGVPASWEQVTSTFRMITDNRDERVSNIALVAGVRRLAGSGWLRWSEATREVRLGPRVAAWNDPELSTLRELWRLIPSVEKSVERAAGSVGSAQTAVDTAVEVVDFAAESGESALQPVESAVELVESAGQPVDTAVETVENVVLDVDGAAVGDEPVDDDE